MSRVKSRANPNNPNEFWCPCPSCQCYRPRHAFNQDVNRPHQVSSYCKDYYAILKATTKPRSLEFHERHTWLGFLNYWSQRTVAFALDFELPFSEENCREVYNSLQSIDGGGGDES
jgi:hypothetical protein